DSHALTEHWHHPWANDGWVYDSERALAQARADAADFVARVLERLRGGGLCRCAPDTALLGHRWPEGPAWLGFAVLEARSAGPGVSGTARIRAVLRARGRRRPRAGRRRGPRGRRATGAARPRSVGGGRTAARTVSTWGAYPPMAERLQGAADALVAVAGVAEG